MSEKTVNVDLDLEKAWKNIAEVAQLAPYEQKQKTKNKEIRDGSAFLHNTVI